MSPYFDENSFELIESEHSSLLNFLFSAKSYFENQEYKLAEEICLSLHHSYPQCFENLFLLGALYFRQGKHSESILYSRLACQVEKNIGEIYRGFGNDFKKQGKIQSAIECFRKALSARPLVEGCAMMATSFFEEMQTFLQRKDLDYQNLNSDEWLVGVFCDLGHLLKCHGDFVNAKLYFQNALKRQPICSFAWFHLAGISISEGDLIQGEFGLKKALSVEPTYFDAHFQLATLYASKNDWEAAFRELNCLMQLHPSNPLVYISAGDFMYRRKSWDVAISYYQRAVELDPNSTDAFCNMGNALKEKGDLSASVSCYMSALKIHPDHPDTLNNLANILKESRRLEEATNMYKHALRLRPNFAAAHSNLASIYKELRQYPEAKLHYEEALKVNPAFADAYSNLGNMYKELGDFSTALQCYQNALLIDADHADAYSNIASTYKDNNDVLKAIHFYRLALQIKPDFPDAFCNLVHCLQVVCDWSDYLPRMNTLKSIVAHQLSPEAHSLRRHVSVQPHHSMLYPFDEITYLNIAKAHGEYALLNVKGFLASHTFPFQGMFPLQPSHRIRVGYVSFDFGNHPTSHLMQSVPGMHCRERVEVFCYALNPDDQSPFRAKISAESEHFVDLSSLSDIQAAQKIHADNIHILINLNGYTKGARNEIFALRPAPIQVMWLGYPGTSGADYMDYIFTDEVVSPPEFSHFYSETLVYIRDTFFATDHRQMFPFMLEPDHVLDSMCGSFSYALPKSAYFSFSPAACPQSLSSPPSLQPESYPFVFCNFNQLYKIDPCIFRAWMRILARVPNSVLWLLQFPTEGRANLEEAARQSGINAARIVFTSVAVKEEHIFRGRYADLFLDTPLCNGHTTAADILWAGTPILTLCKKLFPTRVAASLLASMNCSELIASSLQDYENIAVSIGTDPALLSSLKQKVKAMRRHSPLFDTRRLTKNLEDAYVRLCEVSDETLRKTGSCKLSKAEPVRV